MSVSLAFWKYKPGEYLDNDEVYKRGSEGMLTEGLENLPTDDIMSAFSAEFDGWQRSSDGARSIFGNGAGGRLELMITPQFVRADCSGMEYEDMNKIIDIMHDFACPLYEPSLPQRFDTDINILN